MMISNFKKFFLAIFTALTYKNDNLVLFSCLQRNMENKNEHKLLTRIRKQRKHSSNLFSSAVANPERYSELGRLTRGLFFDFIRIRKYVTDVI